MTIKIGLTGSTGSIGKILIKYKKKNVKFFFYKDDITKKSKVHQWIKKNKLQTIIHLAAKVPIKEVNKNKKNARKINFLGTKYIVDACLKENVEWFFFASTSHVYGSSRKKISENSKLNPISFYGKTKLEAENYIIKKFKKKKIRYCIGRIFSTTNSSQKKNYLVPDLKNKIKRAKGNITLKNLNHYRDFISMKDISKIIFVLLRYRYQGIINLGTGNKVYLKKIAIIISRKYKKGLIFSDNKYPSYLIANIKKLKKIYKNRLITKIEKMIF